MLQMAAPEGAELRLALGMRGGVSLAVWIGGACAEIDDLRRAAERQEGFWWEVLQASNYSRVVVDVMAGASAGGLNGVLFAAAIRHGFHMKELLPIWREVANVDTLRRQHEPWISLFDGDVRFLDVIREKLVALIPDESEVDAATADYVDLQLSATLVEPLDQAAVSPGDERLRRTRSTARFHFRHDPTAAPPRRDLEPADVPRLAAAARATASFPMAFEAAVVRSTRPEAFRTLRLTPPEPLDADPADALARVRLVDCHGVFSESRGRPKAAGDPFGDDDFVVADGGIVDNIPLGKALDAVRDAPADGPTRRVLAYLHPTGPSGIAGQVKQARDDETATQRGTRRRGPVTMVSGLVASRIQGESIDGDLERLEEHNRTVRLGALLRQAVLKELVEPATPGMRPTELALARATGYLVQRAGADAESIQRLLRDPLGVLGEDPFPYVEADDHPDDRWRAPMACWTGEQRLALDIKLRERFTHRLGHKEMGLDLLAGGLGPLTRSIALLLELAREGEKQQTGPPEADRRELSTGKVRLYRLASLVREMNRIRQLGWVAFAGAVEAGTALDDWAGATLTRLNRLLHCDEEQARTLCDPDADPDAFEAASSAYFNRCSAELQAIVTGALLPPLAPHTVDIRHVLVARLETLASALVAGLPPLPTLPTLPADAAGAERSGAEVIQRVLLDTEASFAVRLAALEVLLLEEHLLGAPGGVEIGFARMSAAAPTIAADRFTHLYAYSKQLDEEFTKDKHHLVPDVKLAGNELASFSAFLQEGWRVNDWTWGRMDAVATLVDLLLGEDRPEAERPSPTRFAGIADAEATRLAGTDAGALRRALIARRQQEVFADGVADALPADRGDWVAGLETLVHPGSPTLSRTVGEIGSVAALVVGEALPPSVPRITGPLRGIASRLAARLSRPRGGLPPLVARPRAGSGAAADSGLRDRLLAGLRSLALPASALLVGVIAAALAWAAADNGISLVIGLVVGLVVGVGPGALLLWLALQRQPEPGESAWMFRSAVAVGMILGSAVTGVAIALLVA